MANVLSENEIASLDAYWRAANYLSVGQIYLLDNPLLKDVAAAIATNSAAPTPFFAYALNKGEPSYGTLVAEGYQALLLGQTTPADLAKKIQDGLNSWGYVGAANCK